MLQKDRLRKIREGQNYTQAEMAGIIGVTTSYISHIEIGLRKPSYDTIMAYVYYLGANPLWIMYETGDMFIDPATYQEIRKKSEPPKK